MQITDYSIFPALNATLNGASAVLITTGRALIRRGQIAAHRACMITAVICSALFLISYVYYHWPTHGGAVPFQGRGVIRPIYFTILISHMILAAVIVPMVIVTLTRGLKSRFDRHRAIARWTYPMWLYVSVTGVVIYVMVYRLYRG